MKSKRMARYVLLYKVGRFFRINYQLCFFFKLNEILGHGEGEMWGLSTNPKKYEICTVSDDKTIRIWSLTERKMLRSKIFEKLLRTCEYSQDGKRIAVGTKDGLLNFSTYIFRN